MNGHSQLSWPIIGTILFHVAFGTGLWASGKLEKKKKKEKPLIVEFEVPPEKVKPKPKPIPKKIVAPPKKEEPKVEPVKKIVRKQPVRQPKRITRRAPPPKNTPPPPPDTPVTDDPSPGVGSDDQPYTGDFNAPGSKFVLPKNGTQGPRSGKGSGGGGKGNGGVGVAPPPPKPVSIAAIKKKAMPIGNTDFISEKNYPPVAKQRGIQGKVKVKLLVNAKGRVVKRTLVKRLGFGLDRLALKFAAKLKFTPAINTDDKAVASTVVWTFTFTLPK